MKIENSSIINAAAGKFKKDEKFTQDVKVQGITLEKVQSQEPQKKGGEFDAGDMLDSKSRSAIMILEQLLGKKIEIGNFRSEGNADMAPTPEGVRVLLNTQTTTSYSLEEKQSLEFASAGVVKTEDGKEIKFSMNLQFSREFSLSQTSIVNQETNLSDPLVISMDGKKPVSEGRFEFDLLEGGEKENINYLSKNSAFLAIDKNSDGKINDGSELFGPQSGDGFSELSQYDEDSNGWIDENDSVFKSLKLWYKSENEDKTLTLKEAGIGALSLQAAEGMYDFKDSSNNTLAQIEKTSVALTEKGEAKALFGLNLSV